MRKNWGIRLLDRKKKLPESEALKVLQDILNGFLELLKNGVIHRDLKPPNILNHQGEYKIGGIRSNSTF
jgi:calcium-dependent protein kinase